MTILTKQSLEELKQKARAATPGRRVCCYPPKGSHKFVALAAPDSITGEDRNTFYRKNKICIMESNSNADGVSENLALMAAASPDVILDLIARVEGLDKAVRFYANQHHLISGFDSAEVPSGEVGILCTDPISGEPEGVSVEDGCTARIAIESFGVK